MFQAELRAGFAEGGGAMAAAVVGHDPLHGDAARAIVHDDRFEEVGGSMSALRRPDRGVAEARVIVDADAQAFLASAANVAAQISGDAMAWSLNADKFLGVEVEQLSGPLLLVAHVRSRWRS